jgi:hypothetical protein
MKYPAFVGPSYTSQSPNADCERLINMYVERVEAPGGKDQWQLLPTPGFSVFGTPGVSAAGRGLFHVNGRSFAVVGSNLYEVDIAGVMTLRGAGLNNLDGSPARFCSNGDGGHQVGITSCSKFYVYDLNTNTLTQVLDGPTQCGFVDGFALVLDPATSTLKFSALEDFATFDPLDVAQRNDAPDKWAAMIVSHKEIWLLGSQTTSIYYNSGAADPFVPNPSVFINHGIAAPIRSRFSTTLRPGSGKTRTAETWSTAQTATRRSASRLMPSNTRSRNTRRSATRKPGRIRNTAIVSMS